MSDSIGMLDLAAQRAQLGPDLDVAIGRVIEHGKFIMGPEVGELEHCLAEATAARHVVTCGNGTDALLLALMALGVRAGDAVLVPTFTFAATVEVVALLGAVPVFIDADESTFNVSGDLVDAAFQAAGRAGLHPVGVIAVDLFGQPAPYGEIRAVAEANGAFILADAAQSFGATRDNRAVGTLANVSATSFFPTKPLACYGDGGAVFTDDDEIADTIRSLRSHGQGRHKYENARVGINSRLDTIQAAVLLAKLRGFAEELASRTAIAGRYERELRSPIRTPRVVSPNTSAWAQYTVRLPERDRVAAKLHDRGISSAVYYPAPLHDQPAYRAYHLADQPLATAEGIAHEVLSIPAHAYLSAAQQDRVIELLNDLTAGS